MPINLEALICLKQTCQNKLAKTNLPKKNPKKDDDSFLDIDSLLGLNPITNKYKFLLFLTGYYSIFQKERKQEMITYKFQDKTRNFAHILDCSYIVKQN